MADQSQAAVEASEISLATAQPEPADSSLVGGNTKAISNGEELLDVSVEGDVEDITDDDSSTSAGRHKRKVKRKRRRTRSLQETDDDESSSDDEFQVVSSGLPTVNPADLDWLMWMWYYIVAVSSGAFHVAEYMGEKLADFFGITSPKYQYVIDEYHRMKQEEKDEKRREDRERQLRIKREEFQSIEATGSLPP